jgi:hypothetical protein
MRISLREIKEARVAMRLIVQCKLAEHETLAKYFDEAGQLVAIFMTIVRNKDANMKARLNS